MRPATSALKGDLAACMTQLGEVSMRAGLPLADDDYLVSVSHLEVGVIPFMTVSPALDRLRRGSNHQIITAEAVERGCANVMAEISALVRRAIPDQDTPELDIRVELSLTRSRHLRAMLRVDGQEILPRPAPLEKVLDAFLESALASTRRQTDTQEDTP